MELLRADAGSEPAAGVVPKPRGRFCGECRAFVTTLGRTEGVLCGASACPFPKLSWGEPAALIAHPDDTHRPAAGGHTDTGGSDAGE